MISVFCYKTKLMERSNILISLANTTSLANKKDNIRNNHRILI